MTGVGIDSSPFYQPISADHSKWPDKGTSTTESHVGNLRYNVFYEVIAYTAGSVCLDQIRQHHEIQLS